jgi:hypothetical protein
MSLQDGQDHKCKSFQHLLMRLRLSRRASDALRGRDPSLLDTINPIYLSWATHGIHRTGLPDFSQYARRAFASHMFHGHRTRPS